MSRDRPMTMTDSDRAAAFLDLEEGRGPVPVQLAGGHGHHVASVVGRIVGRAGQLRDGDPGKARLIGVDDRELIGRGRHTRIIVDSERFRAKAAGKVAR